MLVLALMKLQWGQCRICGDSLHPEGSKFPKSRARNFKVKKATFFFFFGVVSVDGVNQVVVMLSIRGMSGSRAKVTVT